MKYLLSLGLMFSSLHLTGQQQYVLLDQFREEIQSLAVKKQIQESFEYLESLEEFTRQNHIALTEIEAPPFAEDERALAFMKMLAQYSPDSIWIDKVGNVLGLWKGEEGRRTVALDAHLDTVFPKGTDVNVRIKGDTLFAPGIGDDTRGLAMVISIAKTLNDKSIRTKDDILLIGTVGEEGLGDLRGVKHLFRNGGPGIDSWISIDGGEIGRINNKGLGSYRYEVTYLGPGGHSWGAFGLVNPHHALGDAIRRFVDRADAYTKNGPRTSYNVGIIQGGTSVNSIPFSSSMQIDIRSVQPYRLDSMEQLLFLSVNEALDDQNNRKRLGKDLTVSITKIGDRPSGELSPQLDLIQRAIAATAYFGKRPRLTRGSTNSNIPISLNVPAVTIGRGGVGANAHALDEWWVNKDGLKSIQLALLLLISEAGWSD